MNTSAVGVAGIAALVVSLLILAGSAAWEVYWWWRDRRVFRPKGLVELVIDEPGAKLPRSGDYVYGHAIMAALVERLSKGTSTDISAQMVKSHMGDTVVVKPSKRFANSLTVTVIPMKYSLPSSPSADFYREGKDSNAVS